MPCSIAAATPHRNNCYHFTHPHSSRRVLSQARRRSPRHVHHRCRLALTRGGLLRRNNAVYSAAFAAGTPLVIVFGGGYGRPIDASVAAHADVFRSAALRVAAL
jgi:hypothetical protein